MPPILAQRLCHGQERRCGDLRRRLAAIVPRQVAGWRDSLREQGLTNSSIRRKMTALRSLYSYLQTYGYTGVNPAHGDFVTAPAGRQSKL